MVKVLYKPTKTAAYELAINLRWEGYRVEVSEQPTVKGYKITRSDKKRTPRPFWTGPLFKVFDGKRYYYQLNYPKDKRRALRDAAQSRKIGYLVRMTKEMNVPEAPQYVLWSRKPEWE
jgi:hypothetical protein